MPGSPRFEKSVQITKEVRAHAHQASVDLFKEIPQLYEDLQYEIARNGLEYADNFRVAIKGNDKSEAAFNILSIIGCCGSFNTTTKINGVTYLIGCNYGH